MFVPRKFTGRVLERRIKGRWKKRMRVNGVCCSKKAGIICMTGNKAGAKCSIGKFLRILHLVPTYHQEIITCVSTGRSFWPAAGLRVTEGQRTLCRTGWKAWRSPSRKKAFKNCSKVVTSALTYMATIRRNSSTSVILCFTKDIFFNSKMQFRPTGSYLLGAPTMFPNFDLNLMPS